jgi:hypothetical protein
VYDCGSEVLASNIDVYVYCMYTTYLQTHPRTHARMIIRYTVLSVHSAAVHPTPPPPPGGARAPGRFALQWYCPWSRGVEPEFRPSEGEVDGASSRRRGRYEVVHSAFSL